MATIVSRHRRRRRHRALWPLLALGLFLSSTVPALARSEPTTPPLSELPPLTIEVEARPSAAVTVVRPAPGAETWKPCARQGDGGALRLCPAGQPAPARLGDDTLHPPAVTVEPQPCGYAAMHNSQKEAARKARCADFTMRRLALAVLIAWYALGLLMATLFLIRRHQRRRDERNEHNEHNDDDATGRD